MRMVFAVAAGSAVGGVLRFLLSAWLQPRTPGFPWATLLVNASGSLVLGVLATWSLGQAGVSAEVRALLTTGLCGGYTTFSTFAYETTALAGSGAWRRAAVYVVASLALALLGTVAGIRIGRLLLPAPSVT